MGSFRLEPHSSGHARNRLQADAGHSNESPLQADTSSTHSEDVSKGASTEDFVWEDLDLDWMSRPDDDVFMVLPTTAQTDYQTSVYQQSVTLYVRLKSNDTQTEMLEGSMEVGPWRVPRDKLPVLVGSLTGICLLFLMGVSLTLYVCLHRRHGHKDFSVKSEASSVSSGRSPKSGQSLSRDSLVLVTGASSSHQARLLSDPTGESNFFLDYSFDFYFDPPVRSATLKEGVHGYTSWKQRNPESLLQRGFSLRVGKLQHDETGPPLRSESGPVLIKTNSTSEGKNEEKNIETQSTEEGKETEIINYTNEVAERPKMDCDFPSTSPQLNMSSEMEDNQLSGSFVLDRDALLDEKQRTRSLPAWVRSKKRPLRNGEMSSSVYDKKNAAKKRRNRMGSDTAQIIALSKSRVQLISSNSSSCSANYPCEPFLKNHKQNEHQSDVEDNSNHPATPKKLSNNGYVINIEKGDCDSVKKDIRFSESQIKNINARNMEYQSLINDAVIIYNERTAL